MINAVTGSGGTVDWGRGHRREGVKQGVDRREIRTLEAAQIAVQLRRTGWDIGACRAVTSRHIKTPAGNVDDEMMVPEEIRAEDRLLEVGKKEGVMHFQAPKRKGNRLLSESEDGSAISSLE